MLRYALDNLGWFEFEQLIQTLLKAKLGLGIEAWGGRGDWGRDAYHTGALPYPNRTKTPGPFLFQSKFVEAANAAGAQPEPKVVDRVCKECTEIKKRLTVRHKEDEPRSLCPIHKSPLKPDTRLKIEAMLGAVMPTCNVHLHDGNDICQWLNIARDIIRSFPQLLSLRDVNELLRECVNAEVIARSETAIAMAGAHSKIFVPTESYFESLRRLGKHSFVVLEGPPEMGKTTIGRIIALTQLTRGWEAIECRHPDDFLKMHRKDAKQVFVADDFFGRTEYDPSRVSSWQADLPHILPRLDSTHWLILTSRAHLLEMAKANLDVAGENDRFPILGQVLVNAGKLTIGEKARILYRHAKTSGLTATSRDIVKQQAKAIVFHPHFTPERIRRLITVVIPSMTNAGTPSAHAVSSFVEEAISNPTKEMRVSFQALPKSHRWFLYSLLEVDEWDKLTNAGKPKLEERYEVLCPLEYQRPFRVVTAEMSEAFVRQAAEQRIDWIHPSCRDLTVEELSANPPERLRFLALCSEDGIQLATSVGGGAHGIRELPLLKSPRDWETLKSRCSELAGTGENVLSIIWRNFKALKMAATKVPSLSQDATHLRQLTEDIVHATIATLTSFKNSTDLARFQDFFEAMEGLGLEIEVDLSAAWANLQSDTILNLQDDLVVWQLYNTPKNFLDFVRLVDKHLPLFLKAQETQATFHEVIQAISDRGKEERRLGYIRDLESEELSEVIEAYEHLGSSYTGLAELQYLADKERWSLRASASYFQEMAEELSDEGPEEPDSDDMLGSSHSEELNVSHLFRDL